MYYVNRIHHGPNIIHSKKPIRTIEDFRGLKLRVPGGMIAEGFAAAGARTTLLPGGEVFSALEKGTVDAADYTGPAVNWALGFQQVTNYIWEGPPGLESIYQPVDLMDFVVRMDVWNRLSKTMQVWLDDEIQVYSNIHHAAIQKADMEAWPKFAKAGTKINRLPAEDLPKFQRLADSHVPLDPRVLVVGRASVELEEHAEAASIDGVLLAALSPELLERRTRNERDMATGAIDGGARRRLHERERTAREFRQRLRPRALDDASLDGSPVEVGRDGLAETDLALGDGAVREAERKALAVELLPDLHQGAVAQLVVAPPVGVDDVEAAVLPHARGLEHDFRGMHQREALDGRDRNPGHGGHGASVRRTAGI